MVVLHILQQHVAINLQVGSECFALYRNYTLAACDMRDGTVPSVSIWKSEIVRQVTHGGYATDSIFNTLGLRISDVFNSAPTFRRWERLEF